MWKTAHASFDLMTLSDTGKSGPVHDAPQNKLGRYYLNGSSKRKLFCYYMLVLLLYALCIMYERSEKTMLHGH